MLGSPEGEVVLDIEEEEVEVSGDRLDLLSVIRGLEALDQPSQVRLFTSSRYVQRGLRYGLDNWRRSAWCWERFGRMVPIKNDDLWKRLDQALQFHQLECRYWRFDGPSDAFRRTRSTRRRGGVTSPPDRRKRIFVYSRLHDANGSVV